MRLAALLCVAVLALPLPVLSATIHVPADQLTIQAGINTALDGDTVLVAPGTYFENVVIDHTVTLLSEAGPEMTTIDGQNVGTVVHIESGVDHVTVEGFRLTHGNAFEGGIASHGNYTVIRRNIVEHNESFGDAAVISARATSITEDNLIQDNTCLKGTGAAVVSGRFERNIVRDNFGPSGFYNVLVFNANSFAWNLVVGNDQGSNEVTFRGGGSIHHNTIIRAFPTVATVVLQSPQGRPYEFHNNVILHGNGPGVDCDLSGADVIRCNNIWGAGPSFANDCAGLDGAEGNFSADPSFCDPSQWDYHLTADSPCAPGSSPLDCELIGAFPVGCGIVGLPSADAPIAGLRLTVIPNPFRGMARFELGSIAQGRALNIFDTQGRLVEQLQRQDGHWSWTPGSAVPAGVYFARPEGSAVGTEPVKFLYLR